METTAQKQAISRQPVIATIYKPPGGKIKQGKYPDGFQEEDFVLDKPLPKPDKKKYGDPEFGGGPKPVYKGAGAKKAPKIRDYGKDSPNLETLIEQYISELQKYLKGRNIKAGIVFLPYSRN